MRCSRTVTFLLLDYDIASAAVDVDADVQVSSTRPALHVATPVHDIAVQGLAAEMTQPSTSAHGPDIAYALSQPVRPHAADTYIVYSSTLQPLSTLQPPPTLSIHGTAARQSDPAYMQHQSHVPAGPALACTDYAVTSSLPHLPVVLGDSLFVDSSVQQPRVDVSFC